MDLTNIRKIINNKILNNGFNLQNINDDTELLKNGYLDSLDIVEIIMTLEEKREKRLYFNYEDHDYEIDINWFYKVSNQTY